MKWYRFIGLAAFSCQLTGAAAGLAASDPEPASSPAKQAPVLRPLEPPDSGQVTLPGPPPVVPPLKAITAVPPAPKPILSPDTRVGDAGLHAPIPPAAGPHTTPGTAAVPAVISAGNKTRSAPASRVVTKEARPALASAAIKDSRPAAARSFSTSPFGGEVAAFCQKQIGHWKEADARKLLGEPRRHRPAFDEKKVVNGAIYAFSDPTGKYKEMELDFDSKTGALRTVFVYPPRLTWADCRRQWTGDVAAADAAQGRKFYSYTNRRLDVLVDPGGKVISLGWY